MASAESRYSDPTGTRTAIPDPDIAAHKLIVPASERAALKAAFETLTQTHADHDKLACMSQLAIHGAQYLQTVTHRIPENTDRTFFILQPFPEHGVTHFFGPNFFMPGTTTRYASVPQSGEKDTQVRWIHMEKAWKRALFAVDHTDAPAFERELFLELVYLTTDITESISALSNVEIHSP